MALPRLRRSEALNQSMPFLTITLVNKLGAIGINLLPILLVQRQASTLESSTVLFLVKSSLIAATLGSGWISDRLGLRNSLIVALACLAVGVGALPFAPTVVLIAALAIVAEFGDALSWISLRLLLTTTVPRTHHKEAIGWVRTVNNLGQIVASSIGAAAAQFGVAPLFLFDAFTSLGALGMTVKKIPNVKPVQSGEKRSWSVVLRALRSRPLAWAIAVNLYWAFIYHLYFAGVAGRVEVLHPGTGLKLFSTIMLVNTVLCTLLAVPATRYMNSPSRAFTMGIRLTLCALLTGVFFTESHPFLLLSAFLLTAGEIALGAFMQFVIIRLIPPGPNEGMIYSSALTFSQVGKLLGATLAFPLAVHAANPYPLVALTVGLGIIVDLGIRRYRPDFEQAVQ